MKNRTIIGVICMVLAIATTFLIAPFVNKISTDTIEVPRLVENVRQGTVISADSIEMVSVKKDTVPASAITDSAKIIGKYAASQLYAGDYLTESKLSGDATGASDVFASLDGSKVAVSVTIDNFAAGLSGKLENGDIISLIIVDDYGKSVIPGEFTYVKVITTTTAGGVDQDHIIKNDDGTYDIPTTVTLLVNTTQAKLLAKFEDSYTVHVALVYRGDAVSANEFLKVQDDYFTMKTNEEVTENE